MRKIQKTAMIPLIDLSECSIDNIQDILDKLENSKNFKPSGKSYLAESRYKGSEKIIKENKFNQIIELGSGFTPHALNLRNCVDKYIEVDFLETIKLKQKIIESLSPNNKNTIYISGDVFKEETWQKIRKEIDLKIKTGIFTEGFMQYSGSILKTAKI